MTDSAVSKVELPCSSGVDALRDVLRRYARQGGSSLSDAEWRAPARLMCDDARARGVRVEELLVGLKRVWPTLIEPERIQRLESSHLLSRLVTLCVEEYYGPVG